MIDYPYSQQIHDKVLADWKDIPFEEFLYDGDYISHPSVSYRLWKSSIGLYPENVISNTSREHGGNLFKRICYEPLERKIKLEKEQLAKQFLGLE